MTFAAASPRGSAVRPMLALSVAVALLAALLNGLLPPQRRPSLLSVLAADQFAWGSSTTDIPISTVSVLAKTVLSRDAPALPRALRALVSASDTVSVQALRDHHNRARLWRARVLCGILGCDVNEVDPRFGLTPLHLATLANDAALAEFLTARGARQVPDHVGREPRNLSFTNFIRNAKAARPDGSDCDFPVADFTADPAHARRETARLVGEGEPVLLRGALRHYTEESSSLRNWDARAWVERFGDADVRVGAVPYADAFNLSTRTMALREFYTRFVRDREADNLYVFNKHAGICAEGYAALVALVEASMPVRSGLLAHPDTTGALQGIHFFFGRAGSGAPFHIHGDAVNAAVHGRKRWLVYTPGRTVYSRKTVKEWVEEDLPSLPEEQRPLECVQHPGDVVYVPLDWGHGVLNLDEDTFGFALELLNRRDTFAHLTGHY